MGIIIAISSDLIRSVAQSCPTLCDPMNHSTPVLLVHHQLPESTQTHVHWVSDAIQHLILCRPLLLLPSIFPSIRVFSNESALQIMWPKYWSFSLSISPSNEHPGLVSFRMDWLALLAVQGTLKSLLQHHSPKASIFGSQRSLGPSSHVQTCLCLSLSCSLCVLLICVSGETCKHYILNVHRLYYKKAN